MKLEDAQICLSLDLGGGAITPLEACRLVEAAVGGGADIIHISAPEPALAPAIDCCRGLGSLAVVDENPDLAALHHADGVFLGSGTSGISHARLTLGPSAVVGVGAATQSEATLAIELHCDYLVISAGDMCRRMLVAIDGAMLMPVFASGFGNLAEAAQIVESGMVRLGLKSGNLNLQNLREEVAAYSRLIGRCI